MAEIKGDELHRSRADEDVEGHMHGLSEDEGEGRIKRSEDDGEGRFTKSDEDVEGHMHGLSEDEGEGRYKRSG